MQIIPQILSRFKVSSTRLLALQCSKNSPTSDFQGHSTFKVIQPSRSFTYCNLYKWGSSHICAAVDKILTDSASRGLSAVAELYMYTVVQKTPPLFKDKNAAQNSPKHAISSVKYIFFPGSGLARSQTPPREGGALPSHMPPSPLNKPSGCTPAFPKISARSMLLGKSISVMLQINSVGYTLCAKYYRNRSTFVETTVIWIRGSIFWTTVYMAVS